MIDVIDPKGWNLATLEGWLQKPLTQEGGFFDFKSMIPRDDDGKYRLKKEFCGYANKRDGFLFFGINNQYRILGVDSDDREFTTKITRIVTSNVHPPTIIWNLYEHIPLEDPQKCVFIVKISESPFFRKPHAVYTQKKGLCVPIREPGETRDIKQSDEIRNLFLNQDEYYPEYNIHILEILRRIKSRRPPQFNLNERVIIESFKTFLSKYGGDSSRRILIELESIEKLAADLRTHYDGTPEGREVSTIVVNQSLEKAIDAFISNWSKNLI